MKIFSFDLLFWRDIKSIKGSKLRDFKEDLKSIVLSILNIVEANIKFRELLQVFNVRKLDDTRDAIVTEK